jgi:hypothetical protein
VVSAFFFAIDIIATFFSKPLVHPQSVENYGEVTMK